MDVALGPVDQSPNNPGLVDILIVIYVPLKEDFSQDEGLRKRNLSFIALLGHNFLAYHPPIAINK